jgi:5-guanidino-2-oxopentanoate decarboxylase
MSKRPEQSVGEALVGLLKSYGVDTVFGIPGVHNVEMYRALPRSGIRHILPRHEQGAGFMADGYARATGKPGVCFTITGPGLLNILTPMAQAWSDSSPMLVISSALDIASSAQGRGRLHEMINQQAAAAAVTATSMRALTARDVQDSVAQAFAQFASTRPRPCYLEIPLDVLSMEDGPGWKPRAVPRRARALETDLLEALTQLQLATHPMIILGGGAHEAGREALSIAEKLDCPILTTTAGKGAVPANHPLVWGYCLGSSDIQDMLAQSDCILAVGTELSETDFWSTSFTLSNVIRIDLDPAVIARPHTPAHAIISDALAALSVIDKNLKARSVKGKFAAPHVEEDDMRKMFRVILDVVRKALPEDTVIASDMTQIAYAANEIFPVSKPHCWLHPVGFGTLGFALPAAIGAKTGVGETPVAALVGDYGFQYTINELGTAAELGLSLPILLWNNHALGQIRDDMVQKGIEPNAVTLRNPDFGAVAKAYGAAYALPKSLDELVRSIATALKTPGPTVIEMTPRLTG